MDKKDTGREFAKAKVRGVVAILEVLEVWKMADLTKAGFMTYDSLVPKYHP